MTATDKQITQPVWDILETVTDPEIPVLTITDLGIVRDVRSTECETEIFITPTYTGCPAMDMISMNIRMALIEKGYKNIRITPVLSPAWTTDWMSEKGKAKLKTYGIAPPQPGLAGLRGKQGLFSEPASIQCPHCNSWHTSLISQFGSTACKALYRCEDCKEPFDYFKCH